MLPTVFSLPAALWIQRQRQAHGSPAVYTVWRPHCSQMLSNTREVAEFAQQNPALTPADHAALLNWLTEWALVDLDRAEAERAGATAS